MEGKRINRAFKILLVIVGLYILLAIAAHSVMYFAITSDLKRTEESIPIKIIREESYFTDSNIIGDRVRFGYSFCFQNTGPVDVKVRLQAEFREWETHGWLKQERLSSKDADGNDLAVLVRSGEKKNEVVYFEGDYLGGHVMKLPYPDVLSPTIESIYPFKHTWRENRLIGYEIIGNRIRMQWSVFLENVIDEDIRVGATLSNPSYLPPRAWIKDEVLIGVGPEGENPIIKKGETVNVIFTFEGEYIGGSINSEDLSRNLFELTYEYIERQP